MLLVRPHFVSVTQNGWTSHAPCHVSMATNSQTSPASVKCVTQAQGVTRHAMTMENASMALAAVPPAGGVSLIHYFNTATDFLTVLVSKLQQNLWYLQDC